MEVGLILIVFFIGLIITVKGGDVFVDAAIWIAEKTGVSSGIIGATIISIATTLPEFFVSTVASDEGFSDMAIGNSLGSYVCNIAFIIGVCALIKPIKINSIFFGFKGVMMISYLSLFSILAMKGRIIYNEGFLLLSLIIFFILINLIEHKKESSHKKKVIKKPVKKKEVILNIIKFIAGAFMIVYGAHLLVDSGVEIANLLRVPKLIVSLTLLAIGTSLPELVTSLSSIIKNQQNISVGNILGSNIMNISIIMGVATLVSSQGLIINKQNLLLDLPMAMLVSLIFILAGILKQNISRLVGLILIMIYIAYVIILFIP